MSRETDMTERNIELSAEFSRYLFEHPEIEKRVPRAAEIILLPEYDADLKAFNVELGKRVEAEGSQVFYVVIKKLRPKSLSRIQKIEFVH